MDFQKGDLVKFWLNSHCGFVIGLITNLYDRDRSTFRRLGGPAIEKWATIDVLTDGIGFWHLGTHRLRKMEEESGLP